MGSVVKNLSEAFDYYSNIKSQAEFNKSLNSFNENRALVKVIPQYSLQNNIRPLFGKAGNNMPCIGNHPDFNYLAGTDGKINNHIVTLFMDIENSTRLNLLYDLEEVHRKKNAFICTAIELIKSFDGHVHRIMGDAVMAYFGGLNTNEYNDIINGLNCAAVLQYFCKTVVTPKLNIKDNPFGIRIGLDYGAKEDVLWAPYGYFNMEEVTATSFYVDVASKLQHQAGRNKIMIGNSLKSYIDLPSELISVKKNSANEEDLYLTPNLTYADGKPINYKKYLFDWEKYISISMIPQIEEQISADPSISVSSQIYEGDRFIGKYFPISYSLTKYKTIKFKIYLSNLVEYPYTVKFCVENHGIEARELGGVTLGNHEKEYEINQLEHYEKIVHNESTRYKGLHYMVVKLIKNGTLKAQSKFGVYIN
jgi:adenylate cyclase